MGIIFNSSIWVSLLVLILLEIILGIDNLVFIAILTNNLPTKQRDKARLIGLSLALMIRLLLTILISWLIKLNRFLLKINNFNISISNLIFIIGGLFLIFKAIIELYNRLFNTKHNKTSIEKIYSSFWVIILQIIFLNTIFSFDSIITAIGMVNNLYLMIIAVIIAMFIMFIASKSITDFINLYPNIAILCLGFLLIIGLSLVVEGFNFLCY
ncbi:hypothetical protein CRV09_00850 [Candidatus Pantoea edessiphila]|uniref:Uncharacterized protein n=1 Tax=Candidatus Pantoea edessiphila TaxID=2044610 RepID=A0A2P5T2M6_9GAMM|nr:TerC family protein [Candidatus Pantoea edessiphila]PPI88845.1 hypothetical protein CRV09_00850 [Candidatus Pantoea edessiphila]